MPAKRPILIAGAGIGGLTLAIALARKRLPAIVFERAPVLEEIGAGLQIPPNASRLLDGFGLGPALDEAGMRPGEARMLDGRADRLIAQMPLGRDAEERWSAPYRMIHRAALQKILVEAAQKAGVEIRLGAEFSDVAETDKGVTASFRTASGNETVDACALVGSDGARSAVRTKLGGGDLVFSGHLAWRAVTKFSARNEVSIWLGPRAHLVTYPLDKSGMLNVVVCTPGSERPEDEHENAAKMRALFRDWCSPVRTLIDASEFGAPWPLYDGIPKHMGKGAITLIGDAAHPIQPHMAQGAALAIEDAVVLSARLAKMPSDPARAFRSYETDRAERVRAVQATSRRNGELFRMSGLGAMARNGMLRALGPKAMMTQMDWVYGYRAG
ncbi:salicylate hydroxylase [Terrihabitans soli]|uniref:Salicylate hydroxylase n=1 Tax=Terrihabitans soli TaxID=708113 RepID=A0A6S6QQI1_9HYPH|nr:FAD-dependent monooxygenase [Terrihabitans soli]BCJ91299.1 salicylate hydroxylase [Terrihabitans soli]